MKPLKCDRYPLLRNLILFQILFVFFGGSVFFFSFHAFHESRSKSSLDMLKQRITAYLSEKEETWRFWKMLSMYDVLSEEIELAKQSMPLADIQVIASNSIPEQIEPDEVILPKGVRDSEYVVYAKLDLSKIKTDYGISETSVVQLLTFFALFVGVSVFSAYFIYRNLYSPIFALNKSLTRATLGHDPGIDKIKASGEISVFLKEISKMYSQIKDFEKESALVRIAQQVAHDIRSPIAALTVVIQILENVPEEQRILIRQAVQRIEDIANDLANTKSKSNTDKESSDSKSVAPQMVSGILDLIVSEKRMQYRIRGGIRIDCNINDKSYGLFANIHENTFKRVFSNLINNAVEALGDDGHIQVNLLPAESNLLIQVCDNGKGIPADVLPKLMQRGETHGKSGGKGLGLFHARETMEEWGGSMTLSSTVGHGTLIEIRLPKVTAPAWFLPQLRIGSSTRVVIIDDDSSIHQIWTGRFKAPQYRGNEVVHFSSAEGTLKAYESKPEIFSGDYVVLCDMELRGEEISGLALLRRVKATDHAVLVTSRFEEPHVRSECKELGIKLIPKNLAGFVPIIIDVGATLAVGRTEQRDTARVSPTDNPDVILIDDQDMIHKTWQMMAKIKKINLKTFHTAEEFFAKCGTLDKNAKIYIDSNLADGVKGEIIAKDIHAKGFVRIYLATGSEAAEFGEMPWISGIVGKQPAF